MNVLKTALNFTGTVASTAAAKFGCAFKRIAFPVTNAIWMIGLLIQGPAASLQHLKMTPIPVAVMGAKQTARRGVAS